MGQCWAGLFGERASMCVRIEDMYAQGRSIARNPSVLGHRDGYMLFSHMCCVRMSLSC